MVGGEAGLAGAFEVRRRTGTFLFEGMFGGARFDPEGAFEARGTFEARGAFEARAGAFEARAGAFEARAGAFEVRRVFDAREASSPFAGSDGGRVGAVDSARGSAGGLVSRVFIVLEYTPTSHSSSGFESSSMAGARGAFGTMRAMTASLGPGDSVLTRLAGSRIGGRDRRSAAGSDLRKLASEIPNAGGATVPTISTSQVKMMMPSLVRTFIGATSLGATFVAWANSFQPTPKTRRGNMSSRTSAPMSVAIKICVLFESPLISTLSPASTQPHADDAIRPIGTRILGAPSAGRATRAMCSRSLRIAAIDSSASRTCSAVRSTQRAGRLIPSF